MRSTSSPTPLAPRRRFQLINRKAGKRLGILFLILAILLSLASWYSLSMPGSSHRGPLPALTAAQRELANELQADVEMLASTIGERNVERPRALADAAAYITRELERAGYQVRRHEYQSRGQTVANLEAELVGTSAASEIVIVGAHYDSVQGTPGADDNASGVAGTLALARRFAAKPRARTIRFLFFVNEEPPAFWTPDMGSWVYAKECRTRGDDIQAMLSLESIGYYDDAPGSQQYPPPLSLAFPNRGDFIAIVGNLSSRSLTHRAVRSFRAHAEFPSEGACLPSSLPGVGWSDHWSFWKEGYHAIMFTGTATFRNHRYHTSADVPRTLDYERTARVVEGIEQVVREVAARE